MSLPVFAGVSVFPELTPDDQPYGIVEITDFSVKEIPVYGANGLVVDAILLYEQTYENGTFFATKTSNGLKFYPYQIWQGEDAAREALSCQVADDQRYLLQLAVVGNVEGPLLKVVSHFALGCPQNINGVPMYIPYTINSGAKVPGALDFNEYFLIRFDPEYMRLISWEEIFLAAEGINNYGGIQVYDAPHGNLLATEYFGDLMQIVSLPTGDWVEIENDTGRRGWIQWREGRGLHPQIDELRPSRYDLFYECFINN